MTEHSEPNGEAAPDDIRQLPTYEEFASNLLESLDAAALLLEDVRHEYEPGIGERRFECTVRLPSPEPMSRYHVHVGFAWDALLTYLGAYGPGADCEAYHDDSEAADCPHQHLPPQALVEVEAEFILGDGGYELQELGELSTWVETAQRVLSKAFPGDDKPSVHVGLAALVNTVLVENFTAEHSWLIDFENQPELRGIGEQIQAALKIIPALADRLPI